MPGRPPRSCARLWQFQLLAQCFDARTVTTGIEFSDFIIRVLRSGVLSVVRRLKILLMLPQW